MSKIDINFEWPVADAGYRIEDVPPPKRKKGQSTNITSQSSGLLIKPKRGPYTMKRPLELRPMFFLDFAGLDGTPETCLEFANTWGLLGSSFIDPNSISKPDDEQVIDWQRRIENFRQTVDSWQAGTLVLRDWPRQRITGLDVTLAERVGGGFKLEMRPRSLISAMLLQLAQAIATDKPIRQCDFCGEWFETGKGTDRRTGARFCSIKCRNTFHNARRAKETKS